MSLITDEAAHPAEASRNDWSRGFYALIPVLAAAVIYAEPLAALARSSWTDFGYSHGYLTVVVCAWLVWDAGRSLVPQRTALVAGLALALVAILGGSVARYAAIDLLQVVAFMATAWALSLVVFGWRGAWRLALPIGYFVTAVPVWDALTQPLQDATTVANEFGLALFGIPAHIDGNYVSVPAGTFEIAGGCSGLHFLIVAVAVATLYAYLGRYTFLRSAGVLALAVALALVSNWVRVFIIIWRGNATEMTTSLIEDHYWFGWYLFLGVLVVLFLLLRTWERRYPPIEAAERGLRWAEKPSLAGIGGVLLITGAVLVWHLQENAAWAVAAPDRIDPPAVSGWTAPSAIVGEWSAAFAGARATTTVQYLPTVGDVPVTMHAAAYGEQRRGAKLIGYGNGIAPEGWSVVEDGLVPSGSSGPERAVRSARVRSPAGIDWTVRYWYEVGAQALVDPRQVKLRQGLQVFGGPEASGIVAIGAPCMPDCAAADAAVEAFYSDGGARLRLFGTGGMAAAAAP